MIVTIGIAAINIAGKTFPKKSLNEMFMVYG